MPGRTAPPLMALWLWVRHKGCQRPAAAPHDSLVNVAANKCTSSKLPRPSLRSRKTCASQSGTFGRAQESRDRLGAKCLQLRCTVRA